jgi:hypothetical protein
MMKLNLFRGGRYGFLSLWPKEELEKDFPGNLFFELIRCNVYVAELAVQNISRV